MSNENKTVELNDEELEQVNGGITENRALDEQEERNCYVYIKNAEGTFSWVRGKFIPNYTGGGIANVRVNGEVLSISLENIDFDFSH